MSGIAGLLHRDGARASPEEVAGALVAFADRGRDGAGTWCGASVALACAQHRTTPQSLTELLPYVDQVRAITVVHDARIDNRGDLQRELSLAGGTPTAVPDGQLLAAAWLRWGERCPEYLLGDFAFAVWDTRERTLFLARDQIGTRSLFVCESPAVVAFASALPALLALPGVPRRLDTDCVIDYLLGIPPRPQATFYAGIARLQPGESLLVSEGAARHRHYYEIAVPATLHAGSPEDVAAGLRDVLAAAVRDRTDAARPTGAMLSGGLDSSAIVCTARSLRRSSGGTPLPTFSFVFPRTPESDESAFIRAVVEQGDLQPTYIDTDAVGPLAAVDEIVTAVGEPELAAMLPFRRAAVERARGLGVQVLLDGSCGDTVVGHGLYALGDLARSLHLIRLLQEIRGLGRLAHVRASAALRRYVLEPSMPAFVRQARLCLVGPTAPFPCVAFVSPDLAPNSHLRERFEAAWHSRPPLRGERELHRRDLVASLPSGGFERVGAAAGVEVRYPFLDRRVVEYCLAVPPSQKIEGGLTRMPLRRALAGLLPQQIVERSAKTNTSAGIVRRLLADDGRRVRRILAAAECTAAARFIDIKAVSGAYESAALRYQAGPGGQISAALWQQVDRLRRAVVLARWLTLAPDTA